MDTSAEDKDMKSHSSTRFHPSVHSVVPWRCSRSSSGAEVSRRPASSSGWSVSSVLRRLTGSWVRPSQALGEPPSAGVQARASPPARLGPSPLLRPSGGQLCPQWRAPACIFNAKLFMFQPKAQSSVSRPRPLQNVCKRKLMFLLLLSADAPEALAPLRRV